MIEPVIVETPFVPLDLQDCVFTPHWATFALARFLVKHTVIPPIPVLDPFAGQGHILQALIKEGFTHKTLAHAVELREEEAVELQKVSDHVIIADYFGLTESFDGLIASNPPYRNGAGLRAAQACTQRAPWVALLLEADFAAPACHVGWIREHIPRFELKLPARPKYIRAACHPDYTRKQWGNNDRNYSWFVWQKGFAGRTEIEWLPDPPERLAESVTRRNRRRVP